MAHRTVVVCILDGWGLRDEIEGNAVAQADTPVFDRLMAEAPHATLSTSGESVGLPKGQMGNSEVGHLNIGAGRVIWMDLPRIDKAISDGGFAANPTLKSFAARLRDSGGTAHVCGLLSDGGVHSHQRHLFAAARAMTDAGLPVALHLFTDGRDVGPKSAATALAALREALPDARAATLSGRFYAMDRDKRWERIEAAFAAMTAGRGETAPDAETALKAAYDRGETDEFVTPTVLGDYAGMKDGDGLLCVNFRADRMRELLAALGDADFDGFDVSARPKLAAMCGMTSYSERHDGYMSTLYPPETPVNTLGAWVARHELRQLRLAETEKYPHVTFFLNGGVEEPYPGEDRHMAPSPKVRTYDMAPEMAAQEVGDTLVAGIRGGDYDLIVVNFANPDMVGHTGDLQAAKAAVAKVDACLGAAVEAIEATGGAMLVFADHGNCEMMIDPETGGPHTAHTLNPVPLILVGGPSGAKLAEGGRLADVAPTALGLMGLAAPPEMTGRDLLAR